jgi:hypothetical protein
MTRALEIAALLLVAMAWAFAFAHAAEYPGKMRLDRDAYLSVQSIYYPGFTIGGASEPLSALALAALLALMPAKSAVFPWIALALAATLVTHVVFWLVTQPVNRIWAKGIGLGGAGRRFFSTGAAAPEIDWTRLRDRWEYSHLGRALLMTVALVALVVALTAA